MALAIDPRLGGEIGRLSFGQFLTDTQATIAMHVAAWYQRGATVLCSPRRSPVSSSLMSQGASERLTEQDLEDIARRADVVTDDEIERRERSAIRRIQRLQRMLPPKALDLVEKVCVLDQPISDEQIGGFAILLSHIGQAFDITHKTALPALAPALRPRRRKPPAEHVVRVKRKEPTLPLSLVRKIARALRPDLGDRAAEMVEAFCDRDREKRQAAKKRSATVRSDRSAPSHTPNNGEWATA